MLERGYRVSGLCRLPGAPLGASEHLRGQIELLAGDLLDHDSLRAAVRRVCPDELYHLAAPSYLPDSWEHPAQTLCAIAGATAALLEAVRELDRGTRVFAAGSGAMFGAAPASPQREDTPCRPQNPYAVAKLAAHQVLGAVRAHACARTHPAENDLYACCGILYNHESERRPERFVTRKITRAAAAIKLGLAHEVVLGDLDAVRDWSFAGDIMRGAWLMLQQERPADYILASGVPHTVADFAEAAFACVGLRADEHVRVDPTLVRAPEETPLVGDPGKARRELGWQPELDFEALVERMVRADLHALQRGDVRVAPQGDA
ncbi:MAG TPA: GDP-mannose 4,6-dehydratase [Solirubrobacteraceae bacterium]|nr:GDP-mannose 4,6-dehydratase [Solirubrobacteraceae bacterium]